jgi:hypothetical protein
MLIVGAKIRGGVPRCATMCTVHAVPANFSSTSGAFVALTGTVWLWPVNEL